MTVSDLLKLSVYLFSHLSFFCWIFAKHKTKINIGPCLFRLRVYRFLRGGFFLYLFGKVQSNRNYERQAGFFYFFSIIHHKHFWQHWLTCEIFYFISWNLGHISRGTARPFVRFVFVSMVFSLHLITRSQKSTKMDEFELSGCTKLRYLHDWCCLALFSCFCFVYTWFCIFNPLVCSLLL